MSSDMHLKAAACLWACVSAASAADTPSRIVSADLCADAYVFALADQEAVAAVSWQAGQAVSGAPEWALDLPRATNEAERLIALRPDLVVFGPSGAGDAARFLDRAGIAHISLQWGEDWNTVTGNLSSIGAALDEAERADALIAELDARRETLAARTENRARQPSVFYLSVTGGAAGAGTLVDEAIRMAGGRNAAADAGAVGWLAADAAWVFRVDPDLIITSYFVDGYVTRNNTGARHSAFRHMLQDTPRIDIPSAVWSCAGPALMEAAEQIAEALDGAGRGS